MDNLIQWLTLALIPRFGFKTYQKMISKYVLEEFLVLDKQALEHIGCDQKQIQAILNPNTKLIDDALLWQQHPDHHIITLASPNYPELLKHIASPPLILFVSGQLNVLHQQQIAIVGSRNTTHQGRDNAYEFAHELAQTGFVITSGLARGIDGICHQAALAATGITIAVLGSGLEQIYPKQNQSIAEIIPQQGALVSEFFPNTPPRAEHFPRRNRIISGLSQGVLVVEATIKSGSLITAQCALDQGREVFALPGSIHNLQAKGCHHLIKQGAILVESVEDIMQGLSSLSALKYFKLTSTQKISNNTDTKGLAKTQLLDNVDYEMTSIDMLVQRSQLSVQEVLNQLLKMELQGDIAAVPGGYVKLRRTK